VDRLITTCEDTLQISQATPRLPNEEIAPNRRFDLESHQGTPQLHHAPTQASAKFDYPVHARRQLEQPVLSRGWSVQDMSTNQTAHTTLLVNRGTAL
jgi:hypothetical protein